MKTNAHALPVFFCFIAVTSGCTRSSDVHIRNPLVAGAVDASTIVKTHKPTEDRFGLPRNALSDEAWLTSVDAEKVCLGVRLREIDPISLREMEAELSAPSVNAVVPIDVQEEPATSTVHQGRVPVQVETGVTTSCTKRDDYGNCLSWDSQPTYSNSFVPGAIEVHEARGELCFPNRGIVTAATEQVTLDIEVRRRAPRDGAQNPWAAWGGGGSSKEVTFRWGFGRGQGGAKPATTQPPAEQPAAAATTELTTVTTTAEAPPPEAPPAKTEPPKQKLPPAQQVQVSSKPAAPPKRRLGDPNTVIHDGRGAWDQRDAP